jgi:hypothetical protein
MFRITNSKGFHMTFANGITISVQFGPGNYCENRDKRDAYPYKPVSAEDVQCKNAEIGIWAADGAWCTRQAVKDVTEQEAYDDVEGWLTTNEVAKYIAWCVAQPSTKTITIVPTQLADMN